MGRAPLVAGVNRPDSAGVEESIHDLHVRLVEAEWIAVRAVAERVRMPVSAAVRLLVLRGLDQEVADPTPSIKRRRGSSDDSRQGDREVALATLLASEHTLLVLGDMAPAGGERASRLEEQAGVAAQRRLERVAAVLKEGRG